MAISIKKPIIQNKVSAADALKFAIEPVKKQISKGIGEVKKVAQKGMQGAEIKSGLVPEGDVRLTANIRSDLHMKLKMKSVLERTTIGELIEDLIESNL